MPIPETRLTTWSHQGAITTSSAAYNAIRAALLAAGSPLTGRSVDVFLQGSYANSTNIYADGDVDAVALYPYTFYKDLSALTLEAQRAHEGAFGPAEYRWNELRDDVLTALKTHFGGAAVRLGHKAIKVQTGSGRKEADVVPAVEFRRYASFVSPSRLSAHWGIQFFDSAGNAIVNYPKYHIERGEDKNSAARTGGRYKAHVRVFKNLRNHLVEHHQLGDGVAPSYLVECALYNVPDEVFIGPFDKSVPRVLDYLLNTPFGPFLCQNGVTKLIGPGDTQWPEGDFAAFVVAANDAWRDW